MAADIKVVPKGMDLNMNMNKQGDYDGPKPQRQPKVSYSSGNIVQR